MSPETSKKIEAILDRVKEPETFRTLAELNLVKKVSVSELGRRIIVYMDIENPRSSCFICGLVTATIQRSIERDLGEEFSREFPGFSLEFA